MGTPAGSLSPIELLHQQSLAQLDDATHFFNIQLLQNRGISNQNLDKTCHLHEFQGHGAVSPRANPPVRRILAP